MLHCFAPFVSDYHLLFYFFKQTSNSKKLTCGFYIIWYCNYNELTKNPNIEYQFPDDHTREDLRCQPFSDYLESIGQISSATIQIFLSLGNAAGVA
jgi:hypothetical protein